MNDVDTYTILQNMFLKGYQMGVEDLVQVLIRLKDNYDKEDIFNQLSSIQEQLINKMKDLRSQK